MGGELPPAENCLKHQKTVYYKQLNTGQLEHNLAMHDYNTHQRSYLQSQFCRTDIFKTVNNTRIKLYNKSPSQLKNTQLFRRKLKSFLLQQTFCSVEEYSSYEILRWKM